MPLSWLSHMTIWCFYCTGQKLCKTIICGIYKVYPYSCLNLLENVNIVYSYLEFFVLNLISIYTPLRCFSGSVLDSFSVRSRYFAVLSVVSFKKSLKCERFFAWWKDEIFRRLNKMWRWAFMWDKLPLCFAVKTGLLWSALNECFHGHILGNWARATKSPTCW